MKFDRCNKVDFEMLCKAPIDLIEQDDKYTFRTIRRGDLHDLRTLQLELFPVKYTKKFYLSLLDTNNTWTVLTEERETDKIIGVCSARVFEENQFRWCGLRNNKIRMGYIMTLGVSPVHRRKGLASKMLDILERRMLQDPYNVTRLTLHCKVDNHQALSFYKTFGFYKAQKIKNYYDFNGRYEDAYQLVRDAICMEESSTNLVVHSESDEDDEETNLVGDNSPSWLSRIFLVDVMMSYIYSISSHITECTFYILDFCRNAWTPGNNRYYHTSWNTLFSSFRRFMNSRAEEVNDNDSRFDDIRRSPQTWSSLTTAKKRLFLNQQDQSTSLTTQQQESVEVA
jgi:ribosomal protein S18 acetylase RimI-like enzyme